MGTINYTTSNYITMGIVPYDIDDLKKDSCFMAEAAEEVAEYGGVLNDDYLYDYISDCYESDYDNIKSELEKHSFYYYNIKLEYGYYEGFSLYIENNFGIAYDSCKDKNEAQKEITEIKQFLIDCADMGLVSCYPGWQATAYPVSLSVCKVLADCPTAATGRSGAGLSLYPLCLLQHRDV